MPNTSPKRHVCNTTHDIDDTQVVDQNKRHNTYIRTRFEHTE